MLKKIKQIDSEVNEIIGNSLFDSNGAHFSACKKYRYKLWRIWDDTKPKVMFIGLNPSTADESKNDPTIRRVISMAKNWGFGGVYMMNLYTYITPYPKDLQFAVGYQDIERLKLVAKKCEQVIFAWGNFKVFGRDEIVKNTFPNALALQINKNGSPKHPLYVKGDIVPVKYNQN